MRVRGVRVRRDVRVRMNVPSCSLGGGGGGGGLGGNSPSQ